ncbi:unnamed protein product [Ixodes persulcatus]
MPAKCFHPFREHIWLDICYSETTLKVIGCKMDRPVGIWHCLPCLFLFNGVACWHCSRYLESQSNEPALTCMADAGSFRSFHISALLACTKKAVLRCLFFLPQHLFSIVSAHGVLCLLCLI